MQKFSRIAIVNRGEPARRLIHAARELAEERAIPLRTIALHTAAERRATFVREADESVEIGHNGGNPYLDHEELASALRRSNADAAWVGWGFVAEDPAFADLCERMEVTFVGPPASVMRRLGDKIEAKILAEQAGVPVAPWSGGAVDDVDAAREHAASIGFPLVIKASAGGGGRGIRLVSDMDEMATAFDRARDEARRSFGDPRVFLERLVTDARHVEVQVIADSHGGAWALGVRDCSIQRRKQKVLEESASPVLTAEEVDRLKAAALTLVANCGYRNAGTVEFLFRPQDRSLAFLEVNARLQVEHPVTEAVTGADLVKLQLDVAAGAHLDERTPAENGHAIEARLNAEDATRGFAPAPGRVEMLKLPTGPGIRVDCGLTEGDEVLSEYDSMIAKIIAWGRDREEARVRLRRALRETAVVIDGGATNKSLLLDLVDRPEFIDGSADTEWLDRLAASDELLSRRCADCALLAAAIESYETDETVERYGFFAAARRGRPEASPAIGRTVELRASGEAYAVHVAKIGPQAYRASLDGTAVDVEVELMGEFEQRIRLAGRIHRVVITRGPDYLIEVDGVAHRVARDEGGLVRAPGPSLVVAVNVTPGDEVTAGTPVVILESMKMETSVTAPVDGKVTEVLVPGNVQVAAGAPLVRIRPEGGTGTTADTGQRIGLSVPAQKQASAHEGAIAALGAIRSLVLGFDIADDECRRLVTQFIVDAGDLAPDDPELVAAELDVLNVFTDIAELSRDRPRLDDDDPGVESLHSPREHYHAYLRSLDAEREGLPLSLRESIERVFGHYGVRKLDRTREHGEAAYRVFVAQGRVATLVQVVVELLDYRLWHATTLPADLGDPMRATLDRLVAATAVRHPAVAELARSVRYACFDQPRIAAERLRTNDEARELLASLASAPTAADAADKIDRLAKSREPLLPLLAERAATAIHPDEPLLEVLVRRFYRVGDLRDLEVSARDGFRCATGHYTRRGRRVLLAATLAELADLARAAGAMSRLVAESPSSEGVAVDIYLVWRDPPDDEDAMAATIAQALATADLPERIGRIAVCVPMSADRPGRHFTFRRGDGAVREETYTRGLHPMIARRLRLPRFRRFALSRLPSLADTYLFRCEAGDDGSDQRLAAFAEVRDIEPSYDGSGALTALPEIERVLANCLESIRRVHKGVPAERRPVGNHVSLYVWPPLEVPVTEFVNVTRRLAPMTSGLGIEEVVLYVHTDPGHTDDMSDLALTFAHDPVAGVTVDLSPASSELIAPFDDYRQRVLAARRRGAAYPYDLVRMLAGRDGTFTEYDFDDGGSLVPVERPPGGNRAGIVVGLVSTPTERYPEGMTRVALLGDPTRSLGSVSEPECARINAAIDLADAMDVPIEWLALSSGARISRDSGTENMDWVARTLRRIITFTQDGGEMNVVVAGINVGAQPYWNAEATMLMHTRGILVMTPDSAMVLTGKQALEFSGGVSAEDNFGIGGYTRIMGPNGQAQYWAPHLAGACDVLFAHYEHTYVAPGERFPRPAATADPDDRDVREWPHVVPGSDFTTVGDIFSPQTNPERKKPFDIRTLMRAVADRDHEPLERWAEMQDAATGVVFDAHVGGQPVALIGFESRPIERHGFLPADGPDQWTAGTLFPLSSKKVARAINAASGSRPLVVLANLSGFDGSPESLRKRQLEYGAEIGRAVVNFDGPIVFCVVSRYHGGAFVVFSGALNDAMEVLAIEDSYASVIGGAPAAAVVFAGDVRKRTAEDPRVTELQQQIAEAADADRAALRARLADVTSAVRSEKLGEIAAEFDAIHSVERAKEVGSVHEIIPAAELRPRIIDAVRRGMARFTSD